MASQGETLNRRLTSSPSPPHRHTQPSVQSVELLGSWDNFSKPHRMERDSRRDRGQWRGCHSFQDIVCDGLQSSPEQKRSGGLKMGQTYYYYVGGPPSLWGVGSADEMTV